MGHRVFMKGQKAKLKRDSNRTALYELNCRLLAAIS